MSKNEIGWQTEQIRQDWREMRGNQRVRVDILPDCGEEAARIDLEPADAAHG